MDKPKLYKDEEIHEMFNTSFLPMIQEFAKRAIKAREEEEPVKFWECQVKVQFSELENPLTYESIKDTVALNLFPITQSDIDKWVKEQQEKLKSQPDENNVA